MSENEISGELINVLIKIHKGCGPGLYERIYESIICYELDKLKMRYKRQEPIRVIYDNKRFDFGFRADLIIEGKVIIEIKSVSAILPVHSKQLITYLRLTGLKLGLLVNFNEKRLIDGVTRIVNGL
jgi:GxxExxY protein